jgi:chaperone modulatory protein CbpM
MFSEEEFCLRVGVPQPVLQLWLEEGWLVPRQDDVGPMLSEVDLARARLIRNLRDDLGVNDEGIGIILDLVDQIHGLRSVLQILLERPGSTSYPGGA